MATVIMNWYSHNKNLTGGLKTRIKKSRTLIDRETRFTTIRLGTKWLNKLNPGDYVAISISDNPDKPNVIGYALVKSVSKTKLYLMNDSDFKLNIGAKTALKAFQDMKSVYGEKKVDIYSIVTVIELES